MRFRKLGNSTDLAQWAPLDRTNQLRILLESGDAASETPAALAHELEVGEATVWWARNEWIGI